MNAPAGIAPVSRGTVAVAVPLESAEYLYHKWSLADPHEGQTQKGRQVSRLRGPEISASGHM